jgi:dipeptidase E
MRNRELLLLSTSTVFGTAYLEHAAAEIRDFLQRTPRVLFVPWALRDHAAYAAKARTAFEALGYELDSLHEAASAPAAVEKADAMFVGGGNTFRLLAALHSRGVIDAIRRRVGEGLRYSGASAGSNVACPTLKTTNDMPIVQPASFEALGLVPFQINPHYVDAEPGSTHMGETRETRLREFHEENGAPVVGLREGAMLRVGPAQVRLLGRAGARLFRKGEAPLELPPGSDLAPYIS